MKLQTKNLLRLLLLAQLLAPLPAQAFFGWGKFPSKFDAQQACSAWRKKGIQITYRDYKFEENPEWKAFIQEHFPDRGSYRASKRNYGGGYLTADDWRWSELMGYIQSGKIDAPPRTIKKEVENKRWSRQCFEERETNQFNGLERKENEERWVATKHFRY